MDETTFRILNAITHDLGSPTSINRLTNDIKRMNHTAHYKNIYEKIKQMEKADNLFLKKIGNSSIINLNFHKYSILDLLSQIEFIKKEKLLKGNTELGMLFLEIETYLKDIPIIDSISIIKPEKNISLNRAEFLIILKEYTKKMFEGLSEQDKEKILENQIEIIHSAMDELQKIHNIKLDYLILASFEFFEIMRRKEQTPLKEMITNQITIFYPQNYWMLIRKLALEGIDFEKNEETPPSKITERDLIYNLARFGYKEMGSDIKEGKDICLELIIISLLIKNDQRRIEAIPMLLEKARNSTTKPIYNLLIFLCMKFNKLGELFGLLRALNEIKRSKDVETAIKMLDTLKIRAKKVDENDIREKMRTYYGDWKK